MHPIIDAHIHLDMYTEAERDKILEEMNQDNVDALICVSNHITSAEKVLELHQHDQRRIKPAIGYHPEQKLPTDAELSKLIQLIHQYQKEIVAVGEVGLPFYERQKNPGLDRKPYIEILEIFIKEAARLDKPVVLHAVYDDAPVVCDLLEKHNHKRAHFHWFKGDAKTIKRMVANNYFISITPDCLYEKEIQQLVETYPIEQIMVETDGPWPFEGPFQHHLTHPAMIHQSIRKIAKLKQLSLDTTYQQLYQNTKSFYSI